MTNAELIATIRAEIERRIHSIENCPFIEAEFGASEKRDGELIAYKDLLSFLSTLEPVTVCHELDESEKPMNLDLEIEIEDYVEQRWQFAEDLNAAVPIYLYDMTLNELKDCARHFYEIGCRRTAEKYDEIEYNRQMAEERQMEKEIPNDLEEAANVYSNCYSNPDGALARAARRAYITGAKWDREQMMKEAVEGIVENWSPEPHPEITIPLNPEEYSNGDKVRVIIVKED